MEHFIKMVTSWEMKYGQRLPTEVDLISITNVSFIKSVEFKDNLKKYYSAFLGMSDTEYDDNLFSFWYYKKSFFTAENDFFVSKKLWPFGDYGYNLNIYSCCYEGENFGSIYVLVSEEIYKIADSLDDFFKLLQFNPGKLLVF